jgi:hypothetical protein
MKSLKLAYKKNFTNSCENVNKSDFLPYNGGVRKKERRNYFE